MPLIEALIGPIASLIDKIIPDPKARNEAKLELIKLQGGQEMETLAFSYRRFWLRQMRPTLGPAAPARAFYM